MSNLTVFSNAGLPAVASLSTALRSIQAEAGPSGVAILKMDKTGHWVFGADQTEIEDDSLWAINPFSFVHGFIAWGDGEVLGEKVAPVSSPLPEMDSAPAGAKRGWETQVGLSVKCINGEDKGLEARYTTTSVGGKKAVQALALAIAEQVDRDQTKPVAIVRLKKDHYQHKSFGRIFTPVFDVVEWVSMSGEPEAVEAEETTAAEAPTGRRRRST
jgi:hypothetical protein